MKKQRMILSILLVLFVLLFLLIIIFVIFDKNKIIKYDEYKINQINKYLTVNSMYYDGIQESLKGNDYNIDIVDLDYIEINKMIASYVITNIVPNKEYGYDNCKDCYKYFSRDDSIRFYDVDVVEKIYNDIFDGIFKRIAQDDIIGFNILYYNEDIDKYYINTVINDIKPKIISIYKDYIYEDDMLYIDYYYSNVGYGNDNNDSEKNNNEISEKIYLYNINDIMVKELMYSDLYDDDNVISQYDNYIEYFDTIRYVFKYNKSSKKYLLTEVKLLEN